MIVDRLFQINDDTILQALQLPKPSHQLTVVEENAVYYAAGYVINKLIKNTGKGQMNRHLK